MIGPQFFTKKLEETPTYGKFVLDPLPLSFGNSLGNALRRTLLSSLKGAAITQVKVNNAAHLFSTVKGVKESVLELVLNLKQLRFQTSGDGAFKVSVDLKGKKKIFGKDVKGEAKVVNGDLYLAEITDDKGKVDIEAIVETGVGLLPEDSVEKKEAGYIALDVYFSPVKKVSFAVEEARVGRKTNFDRLILEVWTDGTITPEEGVKQAAEILKEHFAHILSGKDSPKTGEEDQEVEGEKKEIDHRLKDVIIDELNLPSRVINALLRENIETVSDLVRVGKEKLIGVKGLGKKSFVLIEDELKKMGIDLE
ncbi:DNA-directed RNA polymerase subunit alpha [Candidatus Roizmanbacteria bacterium]|nr:DNA-directed RNA polymerase subunit alpha [Candidatus Roizmanbacteria bacterium]